MRKYLLPQYGNFYKANLHCHTNLSDAALSPEEVKREYMAKGIKSIALGKAHFGLPQKEEKIHTNFIK